MIEPPVERFPALQALEGVLHGFILRIPGLDVRTDREVALRRLEAFHEIVIKKIWRPTGSSGRTSPWQFSGHGDG